MDLTVKKRDGPARIAEITIENKKIKTPNILFIKTNRFESPNIADILISNKKEKTDKPTIKIQKEASLTVKKDLPKELLYSITPHFQITDKTCFVIPPDHQTIGEQLKNIEADIFIVGNASQLYNQPKKFIDFIVALREKIGYQKMIYIPSIGNLTNIALLCYMGIDLFDSTQAIITARNNNLMHPTGSINLSKLTELPCECKSCNKHKNNPQKMSFQDILNHNYTVLFNEIKIVRNAINNNTLRDLVEIRIKPSPESTSILRTLDQNQYQYLEKHTPIYQKQKLIATSIDTLFRPEIRRFQERIINRYKKPKSAKILLLLPCSAKKPYSFSKSHKLFRAQIQNIQNTGIIHELIITSPLGLVPRELELIYPANSYDIPVTGHWFEDEKIMIQNLLKKYLKQNKYEKIIVHLKPEIQEFISNILQNFEVTCLDHPTSNKSLLKLNEILIEATKSYEIIKNTTRQKEDMISRASYQFGMTTSKELLKNCTIRGRYPNQKILMNNIQRGMLTGERGLISLTMDGAEILKKTGDYIIEIYNDFTLKGSVFTPGVKKSNEKIRIGDEVTIIQNNKLKAIGVAQMNGKEMLDLSHGEAVKIRHHY